MPAPSASRTLLLPAPLPAATPPKRHDAGASGAYPADTRMLARQQVRLLSGMTRLLSRLLRSLLWPELSPAERRRVLLLLAHLEHDLDLLRQVTRTQRLSTDVSAAGGDATAA